jgi:hypothetical protein
MTSKEINKTSEADNSTVLDEEKYKDEQWLREKYLKQNMDMKDIANISGVSENTIARWIKRHGIETRTRGHGKVEGPFNDKEWLIKEYHQKRKSMSQIAEECGVGTSTIKRRLHEFDIKTRTQGGYNCEGLHETDVSDEELKNILTES